MNNHRMKFVSNTLGFTPILAVVYLPFHSLLLTYNSVFPILIPNEYKLLFQLNIMEKFYEEYLLS